MKKPGWMLGFFVFICLVVPPAFSQSGSLFDQAIERYKEGKYREVVRLLETYIEEKPEPRAYYILGYSLYELGKHAEATQAFQDAYLIDPEFQPQVIEALFGPPGTWVPPTTRPLRDIRLMQGTRVEESPAETLPSNEEEVQESNEVEMVPVPPEPAVEEMPEPVKPAEPEPPVPESSQPAPVSPSPQPTPEQAIQPPVPKAQSAPLPVPEAQTAPPPVPEQRPAAATKTPAKSPQNLPSNFPFDLEEISRQIPGGPDSLAKAKEVIAGFSIISAAAGVVFYLYFSLCFFRIARKLDLSAAWLAFVPILQIWVMVASAGKSVLSFLLLFSPIIGIGIAVVNPLVGGIIAVAGAVVSFLVYIYLWMCISENVGESKWLGLLILVPVANIVLPGYLAFSRMESYEGSSDLSFDEPEDDGLFQE